jgi:hypothetical protein
MGVVGDGVPLGHCVEQPVGERGRAAAGEEAQQLVPQVGGGGRGGGLEP